MTKMRTGDYVYVKGEDKFAHIILVNNAHKTVRLDIDNGKDYWFYNQIVAVDKSEDLDILEKVLIKKPTQAQLATNEFTWDEQQNQYVGRIATITETWNNTISLDIDDGKHKWHECCLYRH